MKLPTAITLTLPITADIDLLDDGTVVILSAHIKGAIASDLAVSIATLPTEVREAIVRHLAREARSLQEDLSAADAQLAFPPSAGFGPTSSH